MERNQNMIYFCLEDGYRRIYLKIGGDDHFTPEDGSCLMKKKTATMATKKKVLTTVMTPQHKNQSHGRNEDGGIGDERQVGI